MLGEKSELSEETHHDLKLLDDPDPYEELPRLPCWISQVDPPYGPTMTIKSMSRLTQAKNPPLPEIWTHHDS